ncbi:MAG TPA: alpha/beta hydrolase [Candidatus Cybelea sp.]|jgi:pimeloyl-ACP methyl ester carboxylesterase
MKTFCTTDGAELAYEESGAGLPTVLLVHGWQADRSVWREVIEALGADVRTVAVDLRGGGASRNASGPYALERFAADLRELVDSLRVGPAIVVGHSMGGTIALRFALDAPELTRGLVLISPVPASGGGYSAKGEAYLRSTAGDAGAARAWLARTFAGTPDAAMLDRVCAAAARADRVASLESFESWAHADFAEATRSIAAPALVVAPQHDVPDVYERKVAALLPNARFVVLPECGHYAILDRPQEIADSIRRFRDVITTP